MSEGYIICKCCKVRIYLTKNWDLEYWSSAEELATILKKKTREFFFGKTPDIIIKKDGLCYCNMDIFLKNGSWRLVFNHVCYCRELFTLDFSNDDGKLKHAYLSFLREDDFTQKEDEKISNYLCSQHLKV